MQRNVATPAEYLAAVPAPQAPLVHHLRTLILEAAPHAREEIRWGMLNYDDSGGLFALAAQKNYVSLYVGATAALSDMEAELKNINCGKGCLRFKRLEQVPTATLRTLLARAVVTRERDCKPQS